MSAVFLRAGMRGMEPNAQCPVPRWLVVIIDEDVGVHRRLSIYADINKDDDVVGAPIAIFPSQQPRHLVGLSASPLSSPTD
jgi:hypothetical protein